MSTKNLARTVIEGGRTHYYQFQRQHTNGVARVRTHELEHALCTRADADNAVFEPRQPVYRDFADKLGPARRWLRSQVGKPWDKVRGELFARFDTRTTAGRHILFDHLLQEVRGPQHHIALSFRRREFWISPHGILRYRERRRKPPRQRDKR
jgi:hypothetical protein